MAVMSEPLADRKKPPATTRVTRADVAKMAGVSSSTVYMSLQDDSRIRNSTRELVQKVASELNYRPHAGARAMAGGRTHNVGFVFSQISFEENIFLRAYSPALQCVGEILARHNYHLNLVVRSLIEDGQGGYRLPRIFKGVGDRRTRALADKLSGTVAPFSSTFQAG